MFLELGELLGFPAVAAFGEDAFEQLRAGFTLSPSSSPVKGEGSLKPHRWALLRCGSV